MNPETERIQKIGYLILYFFGFLLLWEWLKPVGKLTDTGNISVFVTYIAICLTLQYFRLSWIIRLLFSATYSLFFIYFFYFKNIPLHSGWLNLFIKHIFSNLKLIAQQQWMDMTSDFQTLLFFVLLWLMTYLLHYWVMIRKQIMLFYLMTVIFITVLDTFTLYHGDTAIVRLVIIGFSMLGILTLFRLIEKEKISFSLSFIGKWLIPLALLVAFSTLLGFSGPKRSPIWPDPVPYLKSYSDKVTATQGGGNVVGYGENDNKLGGAFKSDATVVFRAHASLRHYWKVESKNVYTSKGWEVLNIADDSIIRLPANEELHFFNLINKKKSNYTASVKVNIKYDHIPYPEPMGLTKISSKNAGFFDYNVNKEKITSYNQDGNVTHLSEYNIQYELPQYDVALLRKAEDAISLDPQFVNIYTQIPETLPKRVRDLASTITKKENNWFDKAKALENYFDREEFVYDQKKIPYPKENQDYVDQFLFETKRGYCDNFSSAMVVMLRSIGIPSRWAKGYSEGQFVKTEGTQSLYEITNNNAHSWVEVYFPNEGWVPFEPTKGFTNTARFQYPNTGSNQSQTSNPVPERKKPDPNKAEKEAAVKKTSSGKEAGVFQKLQQKISGNIKTVLVTLVILLIGSIWIFRKRGKWIPRFWLVFYKRKYDDERFLKAYLVLLKELGRYGLPRSQNQTLREYAVYVDSFFFTGDMKRITAIYERMIYKDEPVEADWDAVHRMWESLMKKTIA